MIESACRSLLIQYPGLLASIGDRMYPVELPEDVVYPAAVYHRISGNPLRVHKPGINTEHSRIQFVAWADLYDTAKLITRLIAEAFGMGPFVMGSTFVQSVFKDSEVDMGYRLQPRVFGVSCDYVFIHSTIGGPK